MTNRELIKIIQLLDPEGTPSFSVGGYKESDYRLNCAKAELLENDCLCYLIIDEVLINMDEDKVSGLGLKFILRQDNYDDGVLERNIPEEFEKNYKKL